MTCRLRWYDSIFVVLFIYLFILQMQAIWPFTIDDMYISLRYAKNWAAGYGLVWNIHEPPVEGYSNFSFVVLSALAIIFNMDPVFVLKSAGVIGLFFTCYFVYLISRFWFNKRLSLLPCLSLLLYKGQIVWTASGLETTMYEALICASVYYCFRGMGYQLAPQVRNNAKTTYFIAAGLTMAVAGMTRPEAPVLMMLFFILICLDRPQVACKQYWQGTLFFCVTIGLFFLPYFLWRLYYFGYLFPNSVYCKGLNETFTLSLDLNYLYLSLPWLLFSIPACIKAQDKRYYFLWLPSLLYLLMLADSDPIVAFYNRLFLPAFALLLPLALQGMRILAYALLKSRDQFLNVLLCFLFIWASFFFIPKMTLADYRYFSESPVQGEQLRQHVVNWLNTHASPGSRVVLADSGMIPYLSSLNFIDSYCLNNLAMAHYPAYQRYTRFCHEIMPMHPEVIILTSLIQRTKEIYTPSDLCLKDLLAKQSNYQLKQSYLSPNPDSQYRYEIYERNVE
ncbi:MAG: protein LphB [Legionella sp.]|uniref:protein LphB n=1 Tax=Legionella sp. TaxID=459 RepID=UPI0039E34711